MKLFGVHLEICFYSLVAPACGRGSESGVIWVVHSLP